MATGLSLLKPLGYQRKNKCGYCNDSNGSSSYYMSCDQLRVDHYHELVDRGWRRSGKTYYKPDVASSCCPHYTIRLDAKNFQATKEQRQAINRWNNYVLGPEYKRKGAMLCPVSREEKRRKRDTFDVVDAVHKSEYKNIPRPVGRKTEVPIEPAHKLEVTLEADSYSEEKYRVFLQYQLKIHKDPASRWKVPSFKRFLCSGLDQKTLKIRGKTLKLGSYHQCYRLDGKLVAVAVLDLLPHAVSSVYLFYDPEYSQWDFGKMSALREIVLAIEGRYEWYYMGYYIHSCIKMKYKGTFRPSFLLDPESLTWDLFDDQYRAQLDLRKYVSMSANRKAALNNDREVVCNTGDSATFTTSKPISEYAKPPAGSNINEKEMDFAEDHSDAEMDEEEEVPEGSLFEYNIPGVLTKNEVARLDLDHWKLLVRNTLIDLEDLRGWEEWELDDPTSIKGIAAELIAATGSNLLENSVLSLF